MRTPTMKTNYLIIPEVRNKYKAPFSLVVNSENSLLDGLKIESVLKVDTGCFLTTFALGNILNEEEAIIFKKRDIDLFRQGKVLAVRSFGVHDRHLKDSLKVSGKNKLKNCSDKELLKDPRVSFIHSTDNIFINKIPQGSLEFSVNYNRKTPSLLGVNFLKNVNSEIININGVSCFILNETMDNSLYSKVYSLLKRKLIIKDVIKQLEQEGYMANAINSAIINTVSNTYVTEDVFEEKEV